jgi:7-cyano-7-deazaguanine reductase
MTEISGCISPKYPDCINIIMKDLIALLNPKYIEVQGKFYPRGGLSIDPFCNYGQKGTHYEQMAIERLLRHELSF